MIASTAHYPTKNGSRYLQQLCKHFSHKAEVSFDETSGRAILACGVAELSADEQGLLVRLVAEDSKALIQARYAIDSHLVTFAHREAFTGMCWSVEPA